MRFSKALLSGIVVAGIVAAPLSSASAGWRHHGGLIGGLFGFAGGVVVGAATIATAPIAIVAGAVPRGYYGPPQPMYAPQPAYAAPQGYYYGPPRAYYAPGPYGPAPYAPAQYGPAQYGPAPYAPAQYAPAQYGPAPYGNAPGAYAPPSGNYGPPPEN